MDVKVNMVAVLLAAVSSMMIGAFWYGKPGFVKPWMKLARIVPQKKEAAKKSFTIALIIAFISSLVMAYVLAHVTYLSNQFFIGDSFMKDALSSAFWMWIGFQGLRMLQQDSFEGRPRKLTLINAGNTFVTIMVMGIIIGAFKA